jgi:hypothetical protein
LSLCAPDKSVNNADSPKAASLRLQWQRRRVRGDVDDEPLHYVDLLLPSDKSADVNVSLS